ncbi:MAG: hypothetical protein ACPGJV_14925 [Bacteriovoracaceae bacterium]
MSRREEIESKVRYIGGELDLIGYYVKTLFDSSHFPKDRNLIFNLDGESKTIDQYFNSKAHDVLLDKPKPILAPFWQNLIAQLEQRNFKDWTQVGLILLNISPDDQRQATKQIQKIKRNVKKNWNVDGHINMLHWSPSADQDTSIIFLFFCEKNWVKRDDFVKSATSQGFSDDHINKCVVFAINIDAKDRAYDLVAMYLRPEDKPKKEEKLNELDK